MDTPIKRQPDTPVWAPLDGTGWYQQNQNLRLGLTEAVFKVWAGRKWRDQKFEITMEGNYRAYITIENEKYLYYMQLQRMQEGKANAFGFTRERLKKSSDMKPRIVVFGLKTGKDGEPADNWQDQRLYYFEITDLSKGSEKKGPGGDGARYMINLRGELKREAGWVGSYGGRICAWRWLDDETQKGGTST